MRLTLLGLVAAFAFAKEPLPDRLFFVVDFESDGPPHWTTSVLEVRAIKERLPTVRLAVIDAPGNSVCANDPIRVRAVSQRAPRSAISRLIAQANPCEIAANQFNHAVSGVVDVSAMAHPTGTSVVASCSATSEVQFDFPYVAWSGLREIRRADQKVWKVHQLYWDIVEHVFGKDGSSWEVETEEDYQRQIDGMSFVEELRSGAFGATDPCDDEDCKSFHWSGRLEGYRGPIFARDYEPQPSVTISVTPPEAARELSAPAYPALAQRAQIEGEVKIRRILGSATHSAANFEVISGHGLLVPAVLAESKSWSFAGPGRGPVAIEVSVDFSLACP